MYDARIFGRCASHIHTARLLVQLQIVDFACGVRNFLQNRVLNDLLETWIGRFMFIEHLPNLQAFGWRIFDFIAFVECWTLPFFHIAVAECVACT